MISKQHSILIKLAGVVEVAGVFFCAIGMIRLVFGVINPRNATRAHIIGYMILVLALGGLLVVLARLILRRVIFEADAANNMLENTGTDAPDSQH